MLNKYLRQDAREQQLEAQRDNKPLRSMDQSKIHEMAHVKNTIRGQRMRVGPR